MGGKSFHMVVLMSSPLRKNPQRNKLSFLQSESNLLYFLVINKKSYAVKSTQGGKLWEKFVSNKVHMSWILSSFN